MAPKPPLSPSGGHQRTLTFQYEDRRVRVFDYNVDTMIDKTLRHIELEALEKLNLPKGTYDFFDNYGRIEHTEDLQRALENAGPGECVIKVKEHIQFVMIRNLENEIATLRGENQRLANEINSAENRANQQTEASKDQIMKVVTRMERKLETETHPTLDALARDRTQLQREMRTIQEKLSGINITELQEAAEEAKSLKEETKAALQRINELEKDWLTSKDHFQEEITRCQDDLKELQRYMQGKIEVCIGADADLRREQQLTNERLQLAQDDMRLMSEELHALVIRCSGVLEENAELRTLTGQLREDTEYLRNETGQVVTRIHCLEGAATEKWQNFAPGVKYFRKWHSIAKGPDVQLSPDLQRATGRGFLAARGLVVGNEEGLIIADGPCRRFGTAGTFASYFEIEINEVSAAAAGVGGLYVGVCIQSAEEVADHPRKEFDGWLIGGPAKALICRAGTDGLGDPDPSELPDTFAVGVHSTTLESAAEAAQLLRESLKPKPKGEVRSVESSWDNQGLVMADRIGVLFKLHRDGGARLRVSVNGVVKCNHEFIDAPPAAAVGFLTPVVRLAGSGKSIKLLPGLTPPPRILAD